MRPRVLGILFLLLAAVSARPAAGQAVLRPNQFTGSVRWTNVQPAIRALIDRSGNDSCTISSRSLGGPTTFTATTIAGTPGTREVDRYELTVETSSTGISYEVSCKATEYLASSYVFAPIRPPPIFSEPEPDVQADFAECAGLLRFRLPPNVTGGVIHAWRVGESGSMTNTVTAQAHVEIEPGEDEPVLLVRGDGHLYHVRVRFELGYDPMSTTLTYERTFDLEVHCDELVDPALLDCTGGIADPATLGRVTGVFDVEGEPEIPDPGSQPRYDITAITLDDGPWGNYRLDHLVGTPASGAFELESVMPSGVVAPPKPYDLTVHAYLRGGRTYQEIETPPLPVLVPSGSTIDVGDALRIRPAYVEGDVQLAGPPPRGTFGSIVQHVRLAGAETAPDMPSTTASGSRFLTYGDRSLPAGATHPTDGAFVRSAFPGAFSAATAEFLGTYDIVLPALSGEPGTWDARRLLLSMHGDSDEADDHLSSTTYVVDEAGAGITAAPGDRVRLDRRYCMGEINLVFVATSGVFYDPTVTLSSSGFTGIDFLGRDVSYGVTTTSRGVPRTSATAAAWGTTRIAVPAGSYTLLPTFDAINPDGRTSTVRVAPIPVTLGCRQVLTLSPELGITIGVDDVPPCTEAGLVHVSGSVRSDEPVQSVTISVNGDAPITACTDCGVSPSFEADVPLGDGASEVLVRATDVSGRSADVTAYSRWAPEPSALDLRPGSTPLLVARAPGGGLRLTWEAGGEANVYRGSIASLHRGMYDHAGFGACGIGSASLDVPGDTGNWYYLASGTCEWGDGSLGRDSRGVRRPGARDRCP
jgi:hypothetical protein